MIEDSPPFWWRRPGWQARLLWPVSLPVGRFAAWRLRSRRRERFELPVLGVTALAMGGTGRTETALALAAAAQRIGRRPGIVASGPRGASQRIDPHHVLARHLGDEALLLCRAAPTVLGTDRAAAARLLAAEGCDIIIVADGYVGERLQPDRTLLVVDATRGVGNGYIIPAGPVRAPLTDQFRHVDAVLKIGESAGADSIVRLAARAARPVYDARMAAASEANLHGRRLLAFTGTAAPSAFFDLVRAAGGRIEVERRFADGHFYADDELQELLGTAAAAGLDIVTTRRDAGRLANGSQAACDLLRSAIVLETELVFELAQVPETIIRDTIEDWRRNNHL